MRESRRLLSCHNFWICTWRRSGKHSRYIGIIVLKEKEKKTALLSFGLDSFSVSGTIFGVLSSLFVCLNAIFTKKVLPQVNQSVWLLGILID